MKWSLSSGNARTSMRIVRLSMNGFLIKTFNILVYKMKN